MEKSLWIRGGRGGNITTFKQFFLSHSAEKLRTLQRVQKVGVSENFMHKKGISLFSVEICLSHSADKIRRRTLLYFRKFLVSKSFMQRRGHHGFFENFPSHRTKTKNFEREPFCVSEVFWYGKKFMDKRGYHDFPSRSFRPTVLKHFVGGPLCFRKVFVLKSFLDNRGITILAKFFVSQYRKVSWGTLLCYKKFLVWKKPMDGRWGGGYHVFPWEFFCLTVPKNIVGEPFCVSEELGIEKFYA